jgi:hypothetical protein
MDRTLLGEHQAEPDLQAAAVTAHGSGRESGATEIWCDWSRNQPRARFGASELGRAPPMAATPRGNDFSQDGDGDLVRGDSSEIEAGRRLEFREPLRGNAAVRELRPEGGRLSAAADERHMIGIDCEGGTQRLLIAVPLRRNHYESSTGLFDRKGISFDAPVGVDEARLLGSRRANGYRESDPPP